MLDDGKSPGPDAALCARSPRLWPLPKGRLAVTRFLGCLWLRLFGWTLQAPPAVVPLKFVFIAAPHTSGWDLPFMLATAYALGLRISWLGKHTLFGHPLGWLMRWLGGIPVDRRAPHEVVSRTAEMFRARERLVLAVPPEGTRRKVTHWKSGFYYIALQSGAPIGLGFLDYEKKRCGLGPLMAPTGDVRRDMDTIRAFYRGIRGKHRQRESEPRLKEEDARAPVGVWLRVVVGVLALAAAGAHLEAADDPRIADLVKARVLRLALDVGNPLLAVQNPTTSEYRGVTVELANALAARIGVGLRLVPYAEPPEIIFALRDKVVDAGFLAIDPARSAVVDLSPAIVEVDNAYLISPGSPVREAGELDAAGVRIAVVNGYGADLFLTRVLRRARVVRGANPAAALDLVITGRADAMAAHLPSLRALAPRLPGARLVVDHFIAESYGMAVPKATPGWRSYVAEFIEEARASTMVERGIADLGLQGIRVAPAPRRPSP